MAAYSVYTSEFGNTAVTVQLDTAFQPIETVQEMEMATIQRVVESPLYQNATNLVLNTITFTRDTFQFPANCISLELSECTIPGPLVLPQTLTHLRIDSMTLLFRLVLPPLLERLELNACILQELPDIPPSVESLALNLITIQGQQFMEHLPNPLPPNLHSLSAQTNGLVDLPPLPPTLVDLNVCENQLTALPPLPADLRYLNVHTNHLTVLPELPPQLEHLNVHTNNLTSLPQLPPRIRISAEHYMWNPWNAMYTRVFDKFNELYQELGWHQDAQIQQEIRTYIANEIRRAPILQQGRNLAAANALRGTIVHPTGANWYYGQPTTRLTSAGPMANISKFLSGKNKTSHRQQKLQLQEEASRPMQGGRRKKHGKTRKQRRK